MSIELSDDEKKRIETQGWTKSEGVDPQTMIVTENGRSRLAHQSDGACVFLDPSGKCRIHARFGDSAKPRACRLFPLTLHPVGRKIVAGLRFSCPSAAATRGRPLAEQIPALAEMAKSIVPEDFAEFPAPAVLHETGLEWPDFMRFVSCIDTTMSPENQPVALKLRRALHWLGAVEKAGFDKMTGREADEILHGLMLNAVAEVPAGGSFLPPTKMGRLLFRTLVFTYARRDSVHSVNANLGYRLGMLRAMLKFARASGRTPDLVPGLKPVEFAEMEKCFGPISSVVEAILTRFFRVKIQSLHFCGRAFYNRPLIEGFRNLALLYPVLIWLARWHAASEGRTSISLADIEHAVVLADHHHGFSPILASAWSRRRVKLLADKDDISRLCAAYAS